MKKCKFDIIFHSYQLEIMDIHCIVNYFLFVNFLIIIYLQKIPAVKTKTRISITVLDTCWFVSYIR